MGSQGKKKKVKNSLILNAFVILIILPVISELLVIGGILKISPNASLIELCFGKEPIEENFVEFLDVGQGDSTLIKSENSVALIDFGVEDDGAKIQKHLMKMGIKRINLAIITHHHNDHMGGFLRVAEKIKVDRLVINNTTAEDGEQELFEEVIELAEKQNTELILPRSGQRFEIGNAVLSILDCNNSASKENNRSVISMLNICGKKFLFTGDCDGDAEYSLMQSCNVNCDVLKMGHHGSGSSSELDFLRLAQPEIAIASCGYDNLYKHPSEKSVERFYELGIKIYRTDLDKTIRFTFEISKNEYEVSTERGAA